MMIYWEAGQTCVNIYNLKVCILCLVFGRLCVLCLAFGSVCLVFGVCLVMWEGKEGGGRV